MSEAALICKRHSRFASLQVFPVSKGGFFVDTKALPVIVRECIPKEACPEHMTEQVTNIK
jgi:hypothetical protein